MKTITLALILSLASVSVSAQSGLQMYPGVAIDNIGLTDAERARVSTHGDWLAFLDAHCTPIERKSISNQEVVRFRCTDGAAHFVERVTVFSGDLSRELQGWAAFKAKAKNVALCTAAGIIFVVIIYGKSQS